jgi:phosphate uptake regulator
MGEAMLVVAPDEEPEALARKIIAVYVGGYNVLHLKPKLDRLNAPHRAVVKQLVQKNLLGSVIVADASEQMTIQILLSVPEMSVKSALRRMSAIAAAMHRDAVRALREGDRDLAQSVMSSDDEVDRFTLYVIRNLGLAANSERLLREIELAQVSECLDFRVATKSIERVADHAVRIAETVGNLGEAPESPIVEPLRQMSDTALTLFEDSVEALLRRDYLLAEDVLERLPPIYEREVEALQAVQGKAKGDGASLKLIVEDLRRTGEYAGDIAEIALNLTIHQLLVT